MISRNRYNRVMDRVVVTDEMARRVGEAALADAAAHEATAREAALADATVPQRPALRRALPIAAALVLVAAGAGVAAWQRASDTVDDDTTVAVAPQAQELDSAEELAASVEFFVPQLGWLPFEARRASYALLGGELAEVTYEGATQSLCLRVCVGTGDNSGDHTDYASERDLTPDGLLEGVTVTLRGSDDGYFLATWEDGGCSHSILSSEPLDEATWLQILAGLE